MRIKIVSDGSAGAGTSIVNMETGEEIDGVIRAGWSLDATDGFARVTLTLAGVPVEIAGERSQDDG